MSNPFKVCVASDRPADVGDRCVEFAAANLPDGWELTGHPLESTVFVSVLWSKVLGKGFIDARRCYNFHPGILPGYRGAGAYSWALLNEERETGVTLHQIDRDIDHGPIIDVRRVLIGETDTAGSLHRQCMDLLFEMFKGWFQPLLLGNVRLWPNEGGRSYSRKELEDQKDLTRYARAFTFPGKERAFYRDRHGLKHDLEW